VLVGFHTALKPSDLFCVLVAKSAAPMAMSLLATNSLYMSGLEGEPEVHELARFAEVEPGRHVVALGLDLVFRIGVVQRGDQRSTGLYCRVSWALVRWR
jgi:hypothetical protein